MRGPCLAGRDCLSVGRRPSTGGSSAFEPDFRRVLDSDRAEELTRSWRWEMADLFLSHVKEDFGLVEEIAEGLEAAGYTTWYFERDSVPGMSYLLQSPQAIKDAGAVILVISERSVGKHQVWKELVRAAELEKDLVPILVDITWEEVGERAPAWENAIAGAVALQLPEEGIAAVFPRLLKGLMTLGVRAGGEAEADPVEARLAPIAELSKSPSKAGTAEEELQKLLREFPDSARVHHALGQLYNRTFRHAEAIGPFEKAVQLDPDNALFYWDLGLTYQKAGRTADAATSLRTATECGLDASRQQHALDLLKVLREGVA
jgi:TIR domain/TPR repeat